MSARSTSEAPNSPRGDYIERTIEGERLDDGGSSTVTVRVAGILTYTVLKTLAFQDRHENKDAYDLVFVIANYPGGPIAAGRASAASPVAGHPQVAEALALLAARFADAGHDGPRAYSSFLADPDDNDAKARLCNEAVAAISRYLTTFYAQISHRNDQHKRLRAHLAGGTMFINLEDETGLINVIVSKGCQARFRKLAFGARALIIRGRLERHEGAVNVIAEHLAPLRLPATLGSRDFR